MSDNFTIQYEVDDGYVGGARPQRFIMQSSHFDFSSEMTDQELEDQFLDAVQADFEGRISYHKTNLLDFVKWAREQIAKEIK